MATITGLTAGRMLAIEASCIVDGDIVGDDLILTKHDATTINAGNVRGPTGAPGISIGTLDAALLAQLPIGSAVDYFGTTDPAGGKWLMMDGRTVVGAQTAYPTWWAQLPAAMKSGANALMPDARGRMTVGYNPGDASFDAIGETGGAKTHTLTQAELPAVTIAVDPPSTNISINPPSTNISVDPPSTAFTGSTSSDGDHVHILSAGSGANVVTDGPADGYPGAGLSATGSGYVLRGLNNPISGFRTLTAGAHTHTVSGSINIAAFTATVDIASFTATVDIASFNVTMAGGGGAHNNMPPYITFTKIVKVL